MDISAEQIHPLRGKKSIGSHYW